uniref:Uncharacterized protein n=1 Tax=viral metagenome TaxID=1070528 RepID=A0A6M3IJ86_9ZZZZ
MTNISGINLVTYEEDKESGLLTLAKVGDAYIASIKRFDARTGTESSPQIIALDLNNIKQSKLIIATQLEQVEKLIKDLELL